MESKPLIVIIGQEGSNKDKLYYKMKKRQIEDENNKFEYEDNILDQLTPSVSILTEPLKNPYIMTSPNFSIFEPEEQFNPVLSLVHDYSQQAQYRIVSLILCLKYQQNIIALIEKLLKGLEFNKQITIIVKCEKEDHKPNIAKFTSVKFRIIYILSSEDEECFQFIQEGIQEQGEKQLQFHIPKQKEQIKIQINIIQDLIGNLMQYLNPNVNNLFQFFNHIQNQETQNIIISILEQWNNCVDAQIEQYKKALFLKTEMKKILNNIKSGKIQQFELKNINCNWCDNCKIFYYKENKDSKCLSFFSDMQDVQLYKAIANQPCNKCKNYTDKSLTNQSVPILIKEVILTQCVQCYCKVVRQNYSVNNDEGKYQSVKNYPTQKMKSCHELKNNKNGELSQQLQDNISIQKQSIIAIFLSCRSYEKTKILNELNSLQNNGQIIQQGQFKKSQLINNRFYFVDPPCFSFIENVEETTTQFTDYFQANQIHFIFFLINYERTDIIRERFFEMLKKLVKVDRKQMVIVITNFPESIDEEQKANMTSIKTMAENRGIDKIIFLNFNEQSREILEKFQSSIQMISNPAPLQFDETVFVKDEGEFPPLLQVWLIEQERNKEKQMEIEINDIKIQLKVIKQRYTELLAAIKYNEECLEKQKEKIF